MRTGALTLLLLVTACGQSGPGNNQAGGPAGGTGPESRTAPAANTITIAANCTASWDGQPASVEQIAERSMVLLQQAVEAAGGPASVNVSNLPVATVEAPADLGMACADTILFALQRSGMLNVRLKPTGSGAPVLMDFPLNTDLPPPPIPTVLGIGAGGRLTWNSDPLDATGLAAQLGRMGSTEAPEAGEEPPPGGLELRVGREATFGQLHVLLQTINRYHLRPYVYLPSAEAGPGGAQVATPPPDAPPPPR